MADIPVEGVSEIQPLRMKPIEAIQGATQILRFRKRVLSFLCWCFVFLFVCGTAAGDEGEDEGGNVPGFLARIDNNNPIEVQQALLRAESLYLRNKLQTGLPPIAFVLHGPEVEIFFRENYSRYKSIVDLAARLSAFDVIDLKVCRTQLRFLEHSPTELYPFVDTVPFGPDEIARLTDEKGYVRF